MKNLLFIILLSISEITFSQTSLFIMDGDGYPFSNASVFHKNKLVGKTNKEGFIDVSKIPAGETVLITFKDLSALHVIQKREKDKKTTMAVYLVPIQIIEEVSPVIQEIDSDGDFTAVPLSPPPKPSENDILSIVDEQAEFPGGREAMMQWMRNNLKYPQTAQDSSLQGKCYLKFVVGTDGSITDVTVTKSVSGCPQCDAEAVRIVKTMPKWIPGKDKGVAVRSYFNLPVKFELENSLYVMKEDGYPFPNAGVFYQNKLVGKTNKEGLVDVSKIPAGETIIIKHGEISISLQKSEKKKITAVYLIPTEIIEVQPAIEERDRNSSFDAVPPPPPKPYSEIGILDIVDDQAEFPGGREAMMRWMQNNFRYPQSAQDSSLQGKCYLKFVVGTDGSITDVKVVKGVPNCPQCDAEAIRVVKAMPKWIPGKNKGVAVRSYFNLPITFKLDNK